MKKMLERTLALTLALVMALGLMCTGAQAAERRRVEVPAGEEAAELLTTQVKPVQAAPQVVELMEAEDDVIEIGSVAALKAFRDDVNNGNTYAGKTVVLTVDINLETKNESKDPLEWTPIGLGTRSGNALAADAKPFAGTFDGQGHTIKGWQITMDSYSKASGDNAQGFFGAVRGGTVKNLNLNGKIALASAKLAGLAIGFMVEGATAENITTSGSVAVTSGGGVVGRVTVWGTIKNCWNKATVTGTGSNVGGIVGAAYYNSTDKKIVIENCVNTGAVNANGVAVGGIVGLSCAEITGCGNIGTVTGGGNGVGGIVGEQQNSGFVRNCLNEGKITNKGKDSNILGTGGIIGWVRYSGIVDNYPFKEIIEVTGNENYGAVKGQTDAGGIVGRLYNAAVVTGNTNAAASLESSNFIAGIVGSYQDAETPAAGSVGNEVPKTGLTATGNHSSTSDYKGTGACKADYVYNNDQSAESGIEIDKNDAVTPADGKTAENPRTINSLEELKAFAAWVNKGVTFTGTYFLLNTDIDLEGQAWTPVGYNGKTFTGTFDGGNHTFYDLVVNEPDMDNVGLFGHSAGGTIQNVNVVNANLLGRKNVATITGEHGTGHVINCHVSGDITVRGNYKVAGLSGGSYGSVENCSVVGNDGSTIIGTYTDGDNTEGDNVGGLVAFMAEGWGLVENCYVENVYVAGTRKVGGLVGSLTTGIAVDGCAVKNITVECNADESVYDLKGKDSVGIAGLIGLYNNSGTKKDGKKLENCTVSDVTLICPEYLKDTAKLGYVSGGLRKTEEGVPANTVYDPVLKDAEISIDNITVLGTNEAYTVNSEGAKVTQITEFPTKDDGNKAGILANGDSTIVVVATSNGVGYDTLEKALAAASDETPTVIEILAERITVSEDLLLDKDNVTIKGQGRTETTIVISDKAVIEVRGDGVVLKDLNVDSSENSPFENYAPVMITGRDVTMENCTMVGGGTNTYGSSIKIGAAGGTTTFVNCEVSGAFRALYFIENSSDMVVDGCKLTATYPINVDRHPGCKLTVTGTELYGWTSFTSGLQDVTFTGCTFGFGGGYAYLVPHSSVKVEESTFSANFKIYPQTSATHIQLNNCSVTGGGDVYGLINTEDGGTGAVNEMTDADGKYTGGVFTKDVDMTDKLADGYCLGERNDRYCVAVHGAETVAKEARDATCTEEGYAGHIHCSNCDVYIEDGDTTPATGHTPVIVPGYAATTEHTGRTDGTKCAVCGVTLSVQTSIPRLEPEHEDLGDEDVPLAELPLPFVDVKDTDWSREAIAYVYSKGIMEGTAATAFSPTVGLTRASMVTTIYRIEQEPDVSVVALFGDMKLDEWYSEAVAWATGANVVQGYDNGLFGVDDICTREQTVTFLYRYARMKGYDVAAAADLGGFTDADQVSAYALDAMKWAVGNGIIVGWDGKLMAQDSITREQIATIFQRFMEMTETVA